ncbi:hypothetical protein BT96DRAFT_1009260 [Gymnopus androsaceus JB14]|uniref:Uncharacterized protein n=1 Tax=Gymnopus androsaceus JB14 TaxID=1447944 RepID=A0A6A4GD78_9AGAR|nr:hypothetical protein BT96DRAFT_1009260 [Gymnopus androsaceus JB14]
MISSRNRRVYESQPNQFYLLLPLSQLLRPTAHTLRRGTATTSTTPSSPVLARPAFRSAIILPRPRSLCHRLRLSSHLPHHSRETLLGGPEGGIIPRDTKLSKLCEIRTGHSHPRSPYASFHEAYPSYPQIGSTTRNGIPRKTHFSFKCPPLTYLVIHHRKPLHPTFNRWTDSFQEHIQRQRTTSPESATYSRPDSTTTLRHERLQAFHSLVSDEPPLVILAAPSALSPEIRILKLPTCLSASIARPYPRRSSIVYTATGCCYVCAFPEDIPLYLLP